MNHKLEIISLLLVFTYFTSCKTLKKQESVDHHKQEQTTKTTVEQSKGPYHPTKTRFFDLLHTKLEVSFDWTKQYLSGTATLKLKPYAYPQNTLELDAKGMDINKLELVYPKSLPLKFSYDKKIIRITLDKTYTPGDTLSLVIQYTAKPNELPKGGSAAITEDKGLYFINPDGSNPEKPRQIWTQGETEASSAWFPTIDATNERSTQEMYITVDTAFNVLSNGEMIYSKNNSNGTKTEYWKMDLPHAPYLFMMAIGKFTVVEDTMPKSKFDWKDLPIKYYVEPKYGPYAKNIFGNTPEMIEFFSQTLNYKFPWSKYSQVVVRDYVSGAMENTTAVIFMEALQVDDRELLDEHWDGIIAHELFHHWFGDLVTCESWANLPLNESFANYAEYLWAEHKYGKDEAEFLAAKEKDEYFDEAKRKQEPLIRYHYKDKEDMFDRHSYNKGGRVLHMLRNYVGDKVFFSALNLYLNRHQYSSAEVHDLRIAFEDASGQDLNWFFNQWFLSPGHAELKIEHEYQPTSIRLKISQLQDTTKTPIYKLPIPIEYWVNGNKYNYTIEVSKAIETVYIPTNGTAQAVVVDPAHIILGNIQHTKTDNEYIFQYKNSDQYITRLQALQHLFDSDKKELKGKENPKFADPKIKEVLSLALKDPFWDIREYAMEQFSNYLIPDIESYIPAFETIATSDSKPIVKAKAIYLLSSYNSKAYTAIFEKGMEEKPYSVVGASLTGYLKTNSPDAQQKLKQFEDIDNIHIVLPLADHFLETKDLSKYQWFKKRMNTGNPQKLYNMLVYFGQYISLLPAAEKEDGKQVLQKIAKENKYEVIREMAKGFLEMVK